MKRYASIRILACLLAFSTIMHAQQYVFRAYRQADGLKNLIGNALAADRKGYLWLATENGVYRFIGSGFEHFGPEQGIAELTVQSLVLDSNDTVWAGTLGNLYRWDGQRFVPAGSTPIHVAFRNSLAIEDARHLLVVDKKRLYRLEHDEQGRMLSYRPVFPEGMLAAIPALAHVSSVNAVNQADGIHIWIGCGKELYSWIDLDPNGRIKPLDLKPAEWNKKKGLAEDIWDSVLRDRAGNLWVMGRLHVEVIPHGSSRFVDRTIPGSVQANGDRRCPLIEDREGRILAPFDNKIARWDKTQWRMIDRANGLQLSTHIAEMAFDEVGDLWLVTDGNGLFNWVGYENWEGWNDEQSLPSAMVWTIIASRDHRIFIGTDNGPAWIDPRTGSSGSLVDRRQWVYGQVEALGYNRDGTLWSGNYSSVVHIDPATGKTKQIGKLPASIVHAVSDSSGRIFIATDEGIYLSDPASRNSAPLRVKGADPFPTASERVEAGCKSPDGSLWFLASNRLLRFKDDSWTAPPADGMPTLSGPLLDLYCAADGNLWVTGNRAGTWRVTPRGDRLKAWQLVTPPELSALASLAILVDRRGWVWLGTDEGLVVWNGSSWRHLTQESGLIWNDVDQGAMMADADGSLWFGTSDGLSHLLHPERVFDSVPLAVSVTGIRRGNNAYPATQQITLPWSSAPLQLQILSSTTRNRSELVFKYRMEGLQPDWAESRNGVAIFSALPPGNYVFEAMAGNFSLGADSATVKVRVKILSPWWRSDWFFALCGLAFLLLLTGINRLYERHLRARSRELEQMVHERTRELEASREKLRIQATHDGLTGMLNRVAILRALATEIGRAQRENRSVVLALIDLDHFKRINDAYGHLAGDEALRWFAAAVESAIRPYDHAGRYGGEEFLLVLTQIPRQAAEQRLVALHASISNLQVHSRGTHFKVNCSVGAVVYDPSQETVSMESLLAVADQALYSAKAAGRDRVVLLLAGDHPIPEAELSGSS